MNFQSVLKNVKNEIVECDVREMKVVVDAKKGTAIIDVREQDEWDAGHIEGARHIQTT